MLPPVPGYFCTVFESLTTLVPPCSLPRSLPSRPRHPWPSQQDGRASVLRPHTMGRRMGSCVMNDGWRSARWSPVAVALASKTAGKTQRAQAQPNPRLLALCLCWCSCPWPPAKIQLLTEKGPTAIFPCENTRAVRALVTRFRFSIIKNTDPCIYSPDVELTFDSARPVAKAQQF